MLQSTRDMVVSYYNDNISSQRLVQYIRKMEPLMSNQDVYMQYFNINTNNCVSCGHTMKYSGFKNGFRCTQKCFSQRCYEETQNKNNEKLLLTDDTCKNKLIILDNQSKNNLFLKPSFLKYNQVNTQYCYDIVYGEQPCMFCASNCIFKNWSFGYKHTCSNKECINKYSNKLRISTTLDKYDVENVSQSRKIIDKKIKTLYKNFGVTNISCLSSTQLNIRKTNELYGRWIPLEDLQDKKQYEYMVRKITKMQDLTSIANINLRGSVQCNGYHLDHMYSISDGFKNNIPPYIIGHINNLVMIPALENIKKNNRSSISKTELFERILT